MKTSIQIGGGESDIPWAEIIQASPALLGLFLLTTAAIWIGPTHIRDWMSRARSVGIAGLTLELRDGLEAVSRAKGSPVDSALSSRLANRLTANRDLFERAHILWVDDNPLNNHPERALLESLGATVTVAVSNAEAEDQLRRRVWSAVISDINRFGPETGLNVVELCAAAYAPTPIYYVGDVSDGGELRGAEGITDEPEQLFKLILTALIRRER